jgi:hypothetical protein
MMVQWVLVVGVLLLTLVLFGCTTTQDLGDNPNQQSGITTFISEPVVDVVNGGSLGTKYSYTSGKEAKHIQLRVSLECDENTPRSIDFQATDVLAFEGQRIHAEALVQIRELLTEQNIRNAEAIGDSISTILRRTLMPLP